MKTACANSQCLVSAKYNFVLHSEYREGDLIRECLWHTDLLFATKGVIYEPLLKKQSSNPLLLLFYLLFFCVVFPKHNRFGILLYRFKLASQLVIAAIFNGKVVNNVFVATQHLGGAGGGGGGGGSWGDVVQKVYCRSSFGTIVG